MTRIVKRRGLAASALGLALATVCGCSSHPAPEDERSAPPTPSAVASSTMSLMTAPNAVAPGAAGVPRGGAVTAVDGKNADAVAGAIANTVLRYDAALDSSPQDAARRATPWLTPALAARQDAAVAGGGAWWNELVAANGWTSTATTPDPEPPPNLGQAVAMRRLFVTVTPHAASGTPPPQEWVVEVMLTRPSPNGQWLADRLQVQPGSTTTAP